MLDTILVADVAERMGLARERAEVLVKVALEGFGRFGPPAARARRAELLPSWLRPAFGTGALAEGFGTDELVTWLSARERVPPGFALELCEVVAQELANAFEPAERAGFVEGLPAEIAAWFERRPVETFTYVPPGGRGRTIASGRPGARHPLSEARPGAHTESVTADNPHGDRKLSSGHPSVDRQLGRYSGNPRSLAEFHEREDDRE